MGKKSYKKQNRGIFQGHVACHLDIKKGEKCESSDAGSFYLHEDNTYSYSCFSCGGSSQNFDPTGAEVVDSTKKRKINWEEEQEKLEYLRDSLIAVDNPTRKLRADVYEFYGCVMETAADGDKIEAIYYPTYRDGEHKGYRNRKRFQSWHKQVKKKPELLDVLKDFTGGIGDTQKGIEMFGQHLFPAGDSRIIINCGEEDAMTVWNLISMKTKFEGGYPSVSCPSGENIAWVKPHITYLGSFDTIYIIADQDKAGKKFEEDLCKLLPVGKVRIVKLPKGYKDPSDMVQKLNTAKAATILWKALWDAEKYSPAGIMSLSEGWSKYVNRGKDTLIRFPESFGELNHKTHGGAALGEILNIIAASSVGKSSFVKEFIYSALETTDYKIGVVALEETVDEFIEGILSIHMSTQLNEINHEDRDYANEYKHFKELTHLTPEGSETEEPEERVQFLDHQGACTGEELLEKIDFLIKGLDCKIIIVDPVTLAFSGHDTDPDEMASEIVKRVKRHNLLWINVHHVRKNGNGGTANSEGADLAEEDIKGCQSADTEYLTPTGWKRFDEYLEGDLIAEYDIVSKTTKFVKPLQYVKLPSESGFYHLKSVKGIDTMVSPEHTLYYQKQRSTELHRITARDLVGNHRKLSQGFRGRFETVSSGHSWGTGIDLTDVEIRLEVACQADARVKGRMDGTLLAEFTFTKGRKKERLLRLLNEANIHFKQTDSIARKGVTYFYTKLKLGTKVFKGDWWNVSEHQAKIIFEECSKWDGHEGKFRSYYNNCKESCDFIQYLAMGLGVRCTITKECPPNPDSASNSTGNCYRVVFNEEASSTVSLANKDKVLNIDQVEAVDGFKYCFVTSTGAFVSRRNGRIMMTGNSGAWFQTGMLNIIFTRNKVHDNPIIRNTTKIKMSKCRRHGKNTGTAGYIYYNGDNGRLELGTSPEEILESCDDSGMPMKDVPINSFGADEKGNVSNW